VDIRLSWQPRSNIELSLVGQNLVEPRHLEFAPTQVITPQREVERSFYGQITWRF
jgi:iron complex outermembrane receptor protein